MEPDSRMYWIHAITPLHVGAGRGLEYIDLPLMREKVTGWPLVPGSAVKGVLRDRHKDGPGARFLAAAFGRADQDGELANSGSLVFSDARVVCLPVRSLYGTFAWCTSPLALSRLCRDLEAAGVEPPPALPHSLEQNRAWLSEDAMPALTDAGALYLEDLDFEADACGKASEWAKKTSEWVFPADPEWQTLFQRRFAVLADDVFNFLCQTATEVSAHVSLNDNKTVAQGPWYEEALPAETLLAGLTWCDRVFAKGVTKEQLMKTFCTGNVQLQIGGKATVGKGRVDCVFVNGGTES